MVCVERAAVALVRSVFGGGSGAGDEGGVGGAGVFDEGCGGVNLGWRRGEGRGMKKKNDLEEKDEGGN